ncbi:MAG: hypothetical protein WAW52_03940 [Methanothrix sp.]
MKRIFLAFAFRDEDRELAADIEQLLKSHNIQAAIGERLGGLQITPAVQARIDQSDGLIGLLTRRTAIGTDRWATHEWVKDEISYARAKGKRVIALIEECVDVEGMYSTNEYIQFNRKNILKAFLDLSETVGNWKLDAGRVLKIRILPDTLANKLSRGDYRCRYRFLIQGRFSEWKDITLVPEIGGTFVYLDGVQEDYLIQLSIMNGHSGEWLSPASSQWMHVELKKEDQTDEN